ncbi:Arc family DNA-binding protein [Stutzerimonas stutzeri]|uniref:Arc family DNA-binding protein n=1 Tax=Stutzerimonas stutzeri TaxID=316 RepID=UPI0005EADF74|nr:Arc family DNA-binding protein [Stutzerimonas stutzeri]
MSREDPQFKLRMPRELRDLADQAAKASGRSLNAELVARLETSFLHGEVSERLISASRARELALMARSAIPDEVRQRAIKAIARAVRLGHREAVVALDDLNLDGGISDEDLEALFKDVLEEFVQAGYTVKWDDITSLWIKF